MSRKNHKITNWTRIAYGCGHLMGNSVSAMSGVWMLYFFTTFGNLSAKEAARFSPLVLYFKGLPTQSLHLFQITLTLLSWVVALVVVVSGL